MKTLLRFLASGGALAVMGWAFWRFVRPAAARRLTDLQVAARIEQRFPDLQGRVTSTVAFLEQDAEDALAGSYEMRRAVVSETMATLEDRNLGECLDPSSTRKALSIAVVSGLVFAAVCAAWPATASARRGSLAAAVGRVSVAPPQFAGVCRASGSPGQRGRFRSRDHRPERSPAGEYFAGGVARRSRAAASSRRRVCERANGRSN